MGRATGEDVDAGVPAAHALGAQFERTIVLGDLFPRERHEQMGIHAAGTADGEDALILGVQVDEGVPVEKR